MTLEGIPLLVWMALETVPFLHVVLLPVHQNLPMSITQTPSRMKEPPMGVTCWHITLHLSTDLDYCWGQSCLPHYWRRRRRSWQVVEQLQNK